MTREATKAASVVLDMQLSSEETMPGGEGNGLAVMKQSKAFRKGRGRMGGEKGVSLSRIWGGGKKSSEIEGGC